MIEQCGPVWESEFYGSLSRKPGSWESYPEDFDFDESAVSPDENPRLSFENLLEDICGRLQDTKQQGSLKRIRKLEEVLGIIERELDEFLPGAAGPGSA